MTALTSSDYVTLHAFANNNDRIGYWSYLAAKGDSYSALALGVATNETLSGYVANSFFLNKAQAVGLTFSESDLYKVGVDLMRADLASRETAFNTPGNIDGGLTLDVRTIYRYHDNIFKQDTNGQLDGRAWTPELALRNALAVGDQTGNYSQADQIWSNVQSPNFWTQASTQASVPSGVEGAVWKLTVYQLTSYFAGATALGDAPAEFSLRNISHINGWSQDSDGQWFKEIPGSNVMITGDATGLAPERINADPSTTAVLNQIQETRQQLYGPNVTRVAEGYHEYLLADGNTIEVASFANRTTAVRVEDVIGDQPWSSQSSASDAYDRLQSQRVVFDNGSQQIKQYDPNNTHPYTELDIDEDATGKITSAQMKLDGQNQSTPADFSAVGQVLGSALGRALAPNNQFVQLAAGTVAGAAGQKLAQAFVASLKTDAAGVSLNSVFADFDVSIAGAGASSVASFLIAELGTALHLDGFGAQLFDAGAGGFAGSVASQIATEMARGASFDLAIGAVNFGNAAVSAGYSISSLLGTYLAHELVPAQTHAGAVAGSLLGAVGSTVGISIALSNVLGEILGGVLNFIVPGLGSLIGTVLGTLIGDAIAPHPHPSATDVIEQTGYFYSFGHGQVSASDGGDYSVPDQMAPAAVSIVNAYLRAINGVALDHSKQTVIGYVTDPEFRYVSGVVGHLDRSFITPDDTVHAVALDVLQHTDVIGGDLLMKRAHQNSPGTIPDPLPAGGLGSAASSQSGAEKLVTLSGDLSVAQDYENYLNNKEAINALIAANASMVVSRVSCRQALFA